MWLEIEVSDILGDFELSIFTIFKSANIELEVLAVALRRILLDASPIGGIESDELVHNGRRFHDLISDTIL